MVGDCTFLFRMGFQLLEDTAERDGGVGGKVAPHSPILLNEMRSVGGILRFHIMKVEICEKGFFRFAMLWNHFEKEAEKPPDVLFQKTYPQFD